MQLLDQLLEGFLAQFYRQVPFFQALFGKDLQGGCVVDVHRGAGNKRNSVPDGHLQGALIVGLYQEFILLTEPSQAAQIGLRLNQRERGEHHILAAGFQITGEIQPVIRFQFPPAGAHHLAQIDGIHRPFGGVGIEFENALPGPEPQDRPQG